MECTDSPFPSIFKEVLSPRTVTHSLFCNFIHPLYKSLVLIGSTHLDVFNLVKTDNELKFDHIHEIDLNQEVIDAVSVKYFGNSLDSLILAFEEAKFSVITFDVLSYEIKTISMHFYEFDNLKKHRTDQRKSPILRVDPDQRCAVSLVYDDNLGVIPFRNAPNMISSALGGNFKHKRKSKIIPSLYPLKHVTQHDLFSPQGLMSIDRPSPNLSTYVSDLTKLPGVKIGLVEDMQFLYGYYEPTLMILYDPVGTFVGQSLFRKDTMCMMTLSLNLQKRTNPIIWHMQNLPVDCFKLLPVPRPIGGVFILQPNMMIYLNQSQPSCGFALNGYSKKSNFPLRHIRMVKPMNIENCVCSFVKSDQIIILCGDGDLFIATLFLESVMRTVIGIRIEKCFKTIVPTCMNILSSNYLFVGSIITNSVLIRFDESECETELYITSDVAEEPVVETESEFQKFLEDDNKENKDQNEIMEDQSVTPVQSVNAIAPQRPSKHITRYSFKVKDLLKNLGPIRTMSICENQGYQNSANIHDAHQNRLTNELTFVELMATTGYGDYGCISFINFTVKPQLETMFDMMPDIVDMWWVEGGCPTIKPPINSSNENEAMETNEKIESDSNGLDSSSELIDAEMKDKTSEDNIVYERKNYIVLSRPETSMVIEMSSDIMEIEESGFCTTENTVCLGNIGSIFCDKTQQKYSLIYQVNSKKLTLLNGSETISEIHFDTESKIVQGQATDNSIILRTEINELFLVSILSSQPINLLENKDDYLKVDKILPSSHGNTNILSFSIYKDIAGFIANSLNPDFQSMKNHESKEDEMTENDYESDDDEGICLNHIPVNYLTDDVEDEDMFLYAGSKISYNNTASVIEPVTLEMDNIPETIEESEKWLYSNTNTDEPVVQSHPQPVDNTVNPDEELYDPECEIIEGNPQTYVFILSDNGVLSIYKLPNFELQYRTYNFFDFPNLLLNCHRFPHLTYLQDSFKNFQTTERIDMHVEITVCNIGTNNNRPVLFARAYEEFHAYELLMPVPIDTRYMPDIGDSLRMKKLQMDMPFRPLSRSKQDPHLLDHHNKLSKRLNLMKYFPNIQGFRGLFIGGSFPLWLFFGKDGRISKVPMYLEGPIGCFTVNPQDVNDAKISSTFACMNSRGELKMMKLPESYDFEYDKPVKRIAFHKNVQFVQYHIDSKIWSVISSVEKDIHSMFKLNAENSKEEDVLERDPELLKAKVPEYMLEFYANKTAQRKDDPGVWEQVPHAKLVFEPWDRVSCMSIVQLNPHTTYAGTKDFLAIGSNMNYGEEIPVRGKILICDLVNVVPQPNRPLTQYKIKTIYDQEQKGPVTALTSCRGLLVSAIGQKVYVWQLRDGDLVGIAFVDTDSYISQLIVVKDLFLAVDINKPIQVIRFQHQERVLSLVARGPPTGTKTVNTCGGVMTFMQNGLNATHTNSYMGFVSCDKRRNVMVLGYNPLDKNSRFGSVLVRWSDGRLPVQVYSSLRMNDRYRDPLMYADISSAFNPHDSHMHQSIFLGSNLGSIYLMTPVTQRQLTDFQLTEKNLAQGFHHYASLHPVTCCEYRFNRVNLTNAVGSMVNGNMLYRFYGLPHSQQTEIAIKSGMELNTIHELLTELYLNTLHF